MLCCAQEPPKKRPILTGRGRNRASRTFSGPEHSPFGRWTSSSPSGNSCPHSRKCLRCRRQSKKTISREREPARACLLQITLCQGIPLSQALGNDAEVAIVVIVSWLLSLHLARIVACVGIASDMSRWFTQDKQRGCCSSCSVLLLVWGQFIWSVIWEGGLGQLRWEVLPFDDAGGEVDCSDWAAANKLYAGLDPFELSHHQFCQETCVQGMCTQQGWLLPPKKDPPQGPAQPVFCLLNLPASRPSHAPVPGVRSGNAGVPLGPGAESSTSQKAEETKVLLLKQQLAEANCLQ